MFKRVGECNLCGQCCGTNGENPWGKNTPEQYRAWQAKDYHKSFPQSQLCGVTGKDGERLQIQMSGIAIVDGLEYPYEWGNGLHKPGNTQCPFLKDDMTCALYGSTYHWIWEQTCKPHPPKMVEDSKYWHEQFPDCSYKFVEVVE